MKIRIAPLAAGAAFLVMAPAAFAADMPVPQAPYAAVAPAPEVLAHDWTGFYIGAQGGYGWGTFSDDGFETDGEGGLAGGTVGYNAQFGNWVVGLEGDGAWTSIDNEDDDAADYDASLNWLATARGRVGFAFDRILLYGTGGAAFGDLDYDGPIGSGSDTRVGWTAGAGLEFAVTENLSLKGEYLHVDLGDDDIDGAPVEFDTDIVRGGINFRF